MSQSEPQNTKKGLVSIRIIRDFVISTSGTTVNHEAQAGDGLSLQWLKSVAGEERVRSPQASLICLFEQLLSTYKLKGFMRIPAVV